MSDSNTGLPSPSKVAQITFAFWVMKICATTLGETGGDLLSTTLNIGYGWSSIILLSLFAAALCVQMLSREFHPARYWLLIVCTSPAGTTISDYIDRSLGLATLRRHAGSGQFLRRS